MVESGGGLIGASSLNAPSPGDDLWSKSAIRLNGQKLYAAIF